jgi:membrane protein required for colicin V production
MNQLPVNPVDLAILGIMLLSAIFSWVRGFTGEVLAVASWAAASVAAYYLHPMALAYLTPMIPNPKLALAAAIASVFLLTLIFVSLITTKMSDLILDSAIGTLDRTLGLLFGAARGLLIAVVAFMFFDTLVGEKSQPDWLRDARLRPVLKVSSEAIFAAMPDNPEFLAPFRKAIDDTTTKKPATQPDAAPQSAPQAAPPAKSGAAAPAPNGPVPGAPVTVTTNPPASGNAAPTKQVDQQGLQRLIESSTPQGTKR